MRTTLMTVLCLLLCLCILQSPDETLYLFHLLRAKASCRMLITVGDHPKMRMEDLTASMDIARCYKHAYRRLLRSDSRHMSKDENSPSAQSTKFTPLPKKEAMGKTQRDAEFRSVPSSPNHIQNR
ncbi:hypothetical protein O6H91_12G071200 [Diphasiastrum complanatum]|uniref:Uncharacterized protein n=1 Tax=Diphasiastrum complanatum TaxID=34168 RepID=A0ACC2C3F2_DIPCM|nr:hypothetical protein O6H91_12G071200 [Diphasiastrum complanatum]